MMSSDNKTLLMINTRFIQVIKATTSNLGKFNGVGPKQSAIKKVESMSS